MRSIWKNSVLAGSVISLALAGCATTPLKPSTLLIGNEVPETTTKLSADAKMNGAPLVGQGAGAAGTAQAGNAALAPVKTANGPKSFVMPTAVTLPLPAAVINLSGANVITAGGANYQVAGFSDFSMAKVLRENVRAYVSTTVMLNMLLTLARNVQLASGESRSFDLPLGAGKLNKLTMRLDTYDDHAVISIGQGDSATGDGQLAAISYTSPTQGTAVFRAEPGLLAHVGKAYVTTTFDLTKGEATADAVEDSSEGEARKSSGHWVFKHNAGAKAGEPVFSMTAATSVHHLDDAQNSGTFAVLANFASDGGAAAIAGSSTPATNNRFAWFPSDKAFAQGDDKAPTDFYMDSYGADAASSAALKALLPAKSALPAAFPANPTEGDPFADPRYAFPR